jgi:hypothetical protein
MAEIAGAIASGVTLAGLFASCIEIFSVIDMHRNVDEDQAVLSTRLKIEQCRLYTWGMNMGLTEHPNEQAKKHHSVSHLSGTPFANIVHDILNSIFMLFENTNQIRSRYGCEKLKPNSNQAEIPRVASTVPEPPSTAAHTVNTLREPLPELSTAAIRSVTPPPSADWPLDCVDTHNFLQQSFDSLKIATSSRRLSKVSMKGKARWAIRDGQKFRTLIGDIKCLVDGLEALTLAVPTKPARPLDESVNLRIARIQDYTTLEIVEEAASETYPDLAETASFKMAALRPRLSTSLSIEKSESRGNRAVEKWVAKQDELAKLKSGKRRFVSETTWTRFGHDAQSNLDDIAQILYGKDVYSLDDEDLEAVKALYWKSLCSIFDPGERRNISMYEKRSKPYYLRRR